MKTSIQKIIVALSLTCVFLLQACEKKDSEAYNAMKQELTILNKDWTTAEITLRTTMDNLKSDLQDIGKLEQDLTRIKSFKNPKIRKDSELALIKATQYHDSLRMEMKNLNNYINDWNVKADVMTELIGSVESESISPDEALVKMNDLKNFKSQADIKLQQISSHIKVYELKYKELSKILIKP